MPRLRLCPHCRQPIKHERVGIPLTQLKAGIFDAIKNAGDYGITSKEIVRGELYRDRSSVDVLTIKSHVSQINDLLEESGFIIVSDRRRWFLQRAAR